MENLDELKAKQAEIAKKIMDLDKSGTQNDELDQLRKEHEEITAQIEEQPNADEQRRAA